MPVRSRHPGSARTFSRPRVRTWAYAIAGSGFALGALAITPQRAAAGAFSVPPLEWESDVSVDVGLVEVSTPNGTSMANADDVWHLVYLKDGQITHAQRPEGGAWGTPEPLTAEPAAPSSPHIAATGAGELHLVWTDARDGHDEVWTRRFANGVWMTESCIACDGTPSFDAVVAGSASADSEDAMIAWVEELRAGRAIYASHYTDGVYGQPALAGNPAFDDGHPSLAPHPYSDAFTLAWREGQLQGPDAVRQRTWYSGAWHDINTVSESVSEDTWVATDAAYCCGDIIEFRSIVLHEIETAGQTGAKDESVGSACSSGGCEAPLLISDPEAPASIEPQLAHYTYVADQGPNGFSQDLWFPVYSDMLESSVRHVLINGTLEPDWPAGADSTHLTDDGLSYVAVGATDGRVESPLAEVLLLWVEEVEGQRTLVSRRGTAVGCYQPRITGPPSLLISPGGTLTNTFVTTDVCANEPVSESQILVNVFGDQPGEIVWDVEMPPFLADGPGGTLDIAPRGGGCSAAANVNVASLFHSDVLNLAGVKSPDLDADCWVSPADVAIVEAALGTDDFCADLDGSGLVDESDVAVVEASLGELCTTVSVGDPSDAPAVPSLAVGPNPATNMVRIRLSARVSSPVIRVMDVVGRVVRTFHTRGGAVELIWDRTDDAGRRVGAGTYFVVATTAVPVALTLVERIVIVD